MSKALIQGYTIIIINETSENMQISRLFEIIYILLDKKMVTAKELAEHFEVSVRTIYRDIDILSTARIPIYASQGKGGGISLLQDYVLDKSVLSEKEQNEILFGLQSLSIVGNEETERLLSKLSSLFNKNQTNWIEDELSPWGSNKSQRCEFTILKNAILNQQIIEFEYFNTVGEKNNRKIEPLKLLFKVNAWYLQGFCLFRNAYRTFKISRMTNVKASKDYFNERAKQYEESQKENSQNWIAVRLNISSNCAYRVYDDFGENEITKNQDGSFDVVTTLPESNWLIGYLLSFGSDMRVLEPERIRDRVRKQAEILHANHK